VFAPLFRACSPAFCHPSNLNANLVRFQYYFIDHGPLVLFPFPRRRIAAVCLFPPIAHHWVTLSHPIAPPLPPPSFKSLPLTHVHRPSFSPGATPPRSAVFFFGRAPSSPECHDTGLTCFPIIFYSQLYAPFTFALFPTAPVLLGFLHRSTQDFTLFLFASRPCPWARNIWLAMITASFEDIFFAGKFRRRFFRHSQSAFTSPSPL